MRALVATILFAACASDPAAPDTPTFDTPEDVWTWVEIPGTTCANGTPAGVGVYRTTASENLVVYFQGGGACWDGTTCLDLKTAVHLEDTYGPALLASEVGGLIADRSDPTNPLATATFVFVPYCTGDLHAGARVATYTAGATTRMLHHTGATNTQAFVEALHAGWPDAQTIWVSGTSAGGYGATLNLHRFAAAWPDAGLHLLQDGSPFVPVVANYETWRSEWALAFPPECTGCETSFPAVIDAVAARHPASRIGLLHYDNDAVVRAFFGYTGSMVPATNALLDQQYAHPKTRAFVLAGDSHTMLASGGSLVGPGGVTLGTWLDQWVRGDPAWQTVRP